VNLPEVFEISYEQDALSKVAQSLLAWGSDSPLWTFSGGLGAGKTTLIRALCKELGVTDRVTSPTFALVNEYRTGTQKVVYHMDWYRLSSAEEGFEAGLSELLTEPDAICFVEWPGQAAALLTGRQIAVEITDTGEETRHITAHRQ
jgi:tRNA threonylcarbamoyladenosine biosynthesis protein TsaE